MELNVLPWYRNGLQFTCSQCGNCCTGGPGFVWISREEVKRLASFLGAAAIEVEQRYCRKVNGRLSLKENHTPEGLYDCVFLREVAQVPAPDSTQPAIAAGRKACSIYSVRPLQCRTWPFWKENLADAESWKRAAKRCHGMNHGRAFTAQQIQFIRDATDWPASPPTSQPDPNRKSPQATTQNAT